LSAVLKIFTQKTVAPHQNRTGFMALPACGGGRGVKIPIISFFRGGGFLDIGFEEGGFDVCWTNEFNKVFADVYSSGITSWRRAKILAAVARAAISCTDSIRDLTPEMVLNQAFGKDHPELFGVIGGPPCTDFSGGGLHASHEGDAGKLTAVYVKMLLGLQPGFFLLENVPQLETNPKHRKKFLSLLSRLNVGGYSCLVNKLNALEYGVPQDRQRLFVVGFRRDLIWKWYPGEPFPKKVLQAGFRWPEKTHADAKAKYRWPATNLFGHNPVRPELVPLDLCVHRAVSRLPDPETLPNGKDYFVPYSAKFGTIREGDVSGKSFKRLHRYRYSPTAWYGNNEVHLHPWKKRRLSVRETLRLQTVPDSYVMPEEISLSAKFKVIGNGVPCQLAQKIAESIRSFIEESARQDCRQQATAQLADLTQPAACHV
jgi:DNA (cytosine-5)-methyltransferase 1